MLIDKIKEMYHNSKISQNTAPKVLSLLISFLLWIFVMDQVNPEQTKVLQDIPVTLLNIEELEKNGLVLMDDKESFNINAKVVGRRNDLLDVSSEDIKLTASLSGYGKGSNEIPIDIKGYPGNLVVSELSNPILEVNIDRVVELPKLVDIKLMGEIPSGHVKEGIIINPEEVIVSGPESIVNSVDRLVGQLDIEGVVDDIQRDIVIKAIDKDGNNVPEVVIKDKIVGVDYLIDELKTVEVKPVIEGDLSSDYHLVDYKVSPEKVTIKGDSEILDGLESVLSKGIDISNSTYSFERELELQLPEGVQTMYLEVPIKVKVNIEKIVERTYTVPVAKIDIVNLSDLYSTNIATIEENIDVRVKAIESTFENFNIENVNFKIDASDFIIGRNVANIEASIDSSQTIGDVEISVNPSNLFLVVSQD